MNAVAIFAAGLMVGSELAVAAFVHPTLNRLPDAVHLPAASALARVLGRFMPFWYALVFLLTLATAFVQWTESGRLSPWLATSAILWLTASVYSIVCLVPINNQIAAWPAVASPGDDWKALRNKWDLLHRWRVVLLAIAFLCLIGHR